MQGGEARELGCRNACLGVEQTVGYSQHAAGCMHEHDRPAHSAVAHEDVASQSDNGQRHAGRKLCHEGREVVAIRRQESDIGTPAAPPGRIFRERKVAQELAPRARKAARLAHHHAFAARSAGT